jgi:hypothetical protein
MKKFSAENSFRKYEWFPVWFTVVEVRDSLDIIFKDNQLTQGPQQYLVSIGPMTTHKIVNKPILS